VPPLTNAEYGVLRDRLYRLGRGKEELKALPNLPNKTQLIAVFQVLEDFWENNKATVKGDMETALGFSITGTLAKKIGRAWLESKFGRGG